MNKEIFQVNRDEYVGFVNQIKPGCGELKVVETNKYTIASIYSKATNILLCGREIPKNEEDETLYYIYNLPEDNERCAPKPVRKIVLETREEVQKFFDIISQLQNGRTVS